MKEKNFTEEYHLINGVNHYFLHYANGESAPVILFLHGGPGQSEAIFAHYVENYAEKNYTIVHYDQRGAGKTYFQAKKERPTAEQLLSDLLEVVLYIKEKYHKEKLILLGHSWGSILGSAFALKYPQYLHCYIGTGQVVDIMENERYGVKRLLEAAKEAGDTKTPAAIEKLGGYPIVEDSKTFLHKMGVVRRYQAKYGLAASVSFKLIKIAGQSHICGFRDFAVIAKSLSVNVKVVDYMFKFHLDENESYGCDIFYLLGGKDFQTPFELAEKHFQTLNAPYKELHIIPNAGHVAYIDNREEYRRLVCNIAARYVNR